MKFWIIYGPRNFAGEGKKTDNEDSHEEDRGQDCSMEISSRPVPCRGFAASNLSGVTSGSTCCSLLVNPHNDVTYTVIQRMLTSFR
ncbi:hypothetical protein Y032_0037g3525 [Ancylostoma ceylanicum]|uniref:Uncharacterized protein n=1 Tax=Ancylostoma ceylanicum TaxID=53326 RepID=A0A016UJ87_9BILA|nr:hypothetical protein Y032_0037g3525 [Ancylostoma ceylanicum]